jgi:hypothetical protein
MNEWMKFADVSFFYFFVVKTKKQTAGINILSDEFVNTLSKSIIMDYQHQAHVGRYQEIIAQALSSACSNGHVDIVKDFLSDDVKDFLTDESLFQALSSACSNGHVDIVKELLTSHKFIDFYIHCVLTDIFKIIHDVTDQDEFSNLLSCIKVWFYVLCFN